MTKACAASRHSASPASAAIVASCRLILVACECGVRGVGCGGRGVSRGALGKSLRWSPGRRSLTDSSILAACDDALMRAAGAPRPPAPGDAKGSELVEGVVRCVW